MIPGAVDSGRRTDSQIIALGESEGWGTSNVDVATHEFADMADDSDQTATFDVTSGDPTDIISITVRAHSTDVPGSTKATFNTPPGNVTAGVAWTVEVSDSGNVSVGVYNKTNTSIDATVQVSGVDVSDATVP